MTLHSVIGADQVLDWRVSRSGRIATDQKAVCRRGPGRVVLGSKPQLATAKKLVRWAGDSTQARSLRPQKKSCAALRALLTKNALYRRGDAFGVVEAAVAPRGA